MAYYSLSGGVLELRCYLQPAASSDAIIGIHNDRLKIHVTAPPAEGKANKHLIGFLAKILGVPKGRILLTKGQTSRQKTLRVTGVDVLPGIFPKV